MNIVICDDETAQLQLLASYCQKWAKDKQVPCEIRTFKSAESFLFHYEDEKDVDVAFFDIQMAEMTGMDLAKKLRSLGEEMVIVFVTGNPEYVFEGYGVQALDFVVKPVKEEKFYGVLDRVCGQLKKKASYLLIECEGGIHKIKQEDICLLESSGHDVSIHTQGGALLYKKGISTVEKQLDTKLFYRCHRSYIVNVMHIQSITKKEVQIEKCIRVPIARGKWEGLNGAYLAFYRGVLGG